MIGGSSVVFRRKYNDLRAGQTASQGTLSMELTNLSTIEIVKFIGALARLAACSRSL